jgi:hypothetical protein
MSPNLARRSQRCGVKQAEITCGEGIRVAQCTHRDILSRPIAHAGKFEQPRSKLVAVLNSVKSDLSVSSLACQRANGFSPR